jgi:hypothetical protein
MQSEQIDKLTEALVKAQASMGNAIKNKNNPHFKSDYADLSAVLDTVREPLTTAGIAFTQTTDYRDGQLILVTTLAHAGQWFSSVYPLPGNANPQQMGSAMTYARRYCLSAITGVAQADDDAEAAQRARPANDRITGAITLLKDEQLSELNELVAETGTKLPAFCKYLGVSTLDELPSSRFSEAKAALESKRRAA